jgi:hypothetical protein
MTVRVSVIARLSARKAVAISLRLLPRFAPRNDSWGECHCEAFRKESRGNLTVFVIASFCEAEGVAKLIF